MTAMFRSDMKACVQGVYFLFDGDECVYVGSTTDLWQRISQHKHGTSKAPAKQFDSFQFFEVGDEANRLQIEALLIRMLRPKYNKSIADAPSWTRKPCKEQSVSHDLFTTAEALNVYRSTLNHVEAGNILGVRYDAIEKLIPADYIVHDPMIPSCRRVSLDFVIDLFCKLKGEKYHA